MFQKYIQLIESASRLDESFKVAKDKFSEEADPEIVKQYIERFKHLVSKNIINDSKEKDISTWIKAGWQAFQEMVDSHQDDVSNKDIKKRRVNRQSDRIDLFQGNSFEIILPLTEESGCSLGKNTTWCTATVSSRNQLYMYHTLGRFPIYIHYTQEGRNRLASIVYDIDNKRRKFIEVRDEENNEWPIENVINIITLDVYNELVEKLGTMHGLFESLSEKNKLHNATTAMGYALRHKKPFPEGEALIATDFLPGLYYTAMVTKERFEAWEPVLFNAIQTKEYKQGVEGFNDDIDNRGNYIRQYLHTAFIKDEHPFPVKYFGLVIEFSKILAFSIYDHQSFNVDDETLLKLLSPSPTPKNSVIIDVSGYEPVSHTLAYLSNLYRTDKEETKRLLKALKADISDERRYQYVRGYILNHRDISVEFIGELINTWGINGQSVYDIVIRRQDGHFIFTHLDINSFSKESQEILVNANPDVQRYIKD